MTLKIFLRWVAVVVIILGSALLYRLSGGQITEVQSALIRASVYLSILPISYFSQTAKVLIEEGPKSFRWTKIDRPVHNIIYIQTPAEIKSYNLKLCSFYRTGFLRWRVYQIENETFRVFHDTLLNNYYHVD